MSKGLVVFAPGGNAIKEADEKGTTEEQFRNVDTAAREIAKIARAGYTVVVTHGNGSQAGFILAKTLQAGKFMLLTDVENVYINYNKPDQKALNKNNLEEAKRYLDEGTGIIIKL